MPYQNGVDPAVDDDTRPATALPSALTDTRYSRLSRAALNELMNTLRDAGIETTSDTTDIILPKIVVTGKQSSGKSSLIEALSDIKLPREFGTCTRCPMEVRLRTSPPADRTDWLCKISITRPLGASELTGDQRPESARKDESAPLPIKSIDFAVIRNKKDVEKSVRRAQLAVLLDDEPLEQFQNLDIFLRKKQEFEGEVSKKFSRNPVILDIMGADVDLTFIDLPGLIEHDERQENIDTVKQLTDLYVEQEECLVLVTSPMSDDLANQKALQIANTYDEDRLRTIIVLTKPDLVGRGDQRKWIREINSTNDSYHHGCFLTKLSTTDERHLDSFQAREIEKVHFDHNWRGLSQDRLGVKKLAEYLSVQLSSMILKRLPMLGNRLRDKRKDLAEELRKLPAPLSGDPQEEIITLSTAFLDDIRAFTCGLPFPGDTDDLVFHQRSDPYFQWLRYNIENSCITFVQGDLTLTYGRVYGQFPASPPWLSQAPDRSQNAGDSMSAGRWMENDEVDMSESDTDESGEPSQRRCDFTLEQVGQKIKKAKCRELPTIVPFSVHEYYIKTCLFRWHNFSKKCFEEVKNILQKYVYAAVKTHFQHLPELNQKARIVTKDLVKDFTDLTLKELDYLSRMELHRPLIQNNEEYTVMKAGIFRKMQTEYAPQLETLVRYSAEIDVVCHVITYFAISSRRYIDYVPMVLETRFAKEYSDELKRVFLARLGIIGENGRANCENYYREDAMVRVKREDLMRREKILDQANEIYEDIFNESS